MSCDAWKKEKQLSQSMWPLCSVDEEHFSLRALASKSLVREFSQHAHCLILVVAVASY